MLGTITFDGAGKATLTQNKNTEGDITSITTNYLYQVVEDAVPTVSDQAHPNINTDVLRLFSTETPTTPYATALIGMDGKILAFYENGTENRFLGYALLQN